MQAVRAPSPHAPRSCIRPGHYEVSVACAEHGLWSAVRDAGPGTAVLADGFSCHTQIQAGHLGREGIHLAELLADLIGDTGWHQV